MPIDLDAAEACGGVGNVSPAAKLRRRARTTYALGGAWIRPDGTVNEDSFLIGAMHVAAGEFAPHAPPLPSPAAVAAPSLGAFPPPAAPAPPSPVAPTYARFYAATDAAQRRVAYLLRRPRDAPTRNAATNARRRIADMAPDALSPPRRRRRRAAESAADAPAAPNPQPTARTAVVDPARPRSTGTSSRVAQRRVAIAAEGNADATCVASAVRRAPGPRQTRGRAAGHRPAAQRPHQPLRRPPTRRRSSRRGSARRPSRRPQQPANPGPVSRFTDDAIERLWRPEPSPLRGSTRESPL